MVITLIGLSGCGKSHLGRRLAEEKGFTLRCCDDLIEARLGEKLKEKGLSSIRGVATWMGQPYDPGYSDAEREYLQLERVVMEEILSSLGNDGWGIPDDTVIDTSGSVVYCGESILQGLKQRSRIIYLAVPDSELGFMFEQYLRDPKPVIWNNSFSIEEGESQRDALARSYPKLVRERAKLYQQYADVTLMIDRDNRDKFSVRRLLQLAGAR